MKSIGLLLVLVSLYSCSTEGHSSRNNDNQPDIAQNTFEDTITSDLETDSISISEIDYGRKTIRLSHKINTTSNEVYPILSKDGKTLFFSGMDRTGFFDFKQDFIKSKNCGG